MIFLRSAAFNLAMFGSGVVLSLWALVIWAVARRRLSDVSYAWSVFVLFSLRRLCGITVELSGAEHLPQGAALIAAQHQSAFDTMVWFTLLHRPCYVLKKELTKIPVFGWMLVPTGMIAVDRDGGAASLRGLIADCQATLAAGRPVIVFPEGTRVPPGARGTLQPGIVALARALNIPVIPAATDSGRRWSRRAFFKTPGPIHIKIYPPLPPQRPRAETLAAIAQHFYEDGVG